MVQEYYKPAIQEKIDRLIHQMPSLDARLFYVKGLGQVYYILCKLSDDNPKTREMLELFEKYVNVLHEQRPSADNIDDVNEVVNTYMLPILSHLGKQHHYSIHNNMWLPILVGLLIDAGLWISGYLEGFYYLPISTIVLVTARSGFEHYKKSRNKLLYLK